MTEQIEKFGFANGIQQIGLVLSTRPIYRVAQKKTPDLISGKIHVPKENPPVSSVRPRLKIGGIFLGP